MRHSHIAEGSPTGCAELDRESGLVTEGLKALAEEHPLALVVKGHCMAPRLEPGSEIIVSPRRRYWPGDILAFRSRQSELRVHRLIGFHRRNSRLLLQTRADASGTLDPPLLPEQVIGRVIAGPRAARVSLADRLTAAARFVRLWRAGVFSR